MRFATIRADDAEHLAIAEGDGYRRLDTDWEVELAAVVGRRVRRVKEHDALD